MIKLNKIIVKINLKIENVIIKTYIDLDSLYAQKL